MTESTSTKENTEKKVGKRLRGVVVSAKMQDTAIVQVERYVKHPKYGKYQKKWKRYKADDKGNQYAVGDTVIIQETKPMSKDKTFRIIGSAETI